MMTIEYTDAYGVTIQAARRLTDEEKSHYAAWYKDRALVALDDGITLPHIGWQDMPARPADGEFNGCSNRAWIISDDEVETYKRLNAERAEAEELKHIRNQVDACRRIVNACERGYMADDEAQARKMEAEYSNAHNEGGEGYIPTWYTRSEYEAAVAYIAENNSK